MLSWLECVTDHDEVGGERPQWRAARTSPEISCTCHRGASGPRNVAKSLILSAINFVMLLGAEYAIAPPMHLLC